MFEERKKMLKKGKKIYVIPEGGSTTLGIWGYISFIRELNKQINLKKIDGILAGSGSGGTAAGLLLGSALLKLDLKIFAVNVFYSEKVIKNKIIQLAEAGNLDYKLGVKINTDNLVILDGYSEEGYKNISTDKVRIIKSFFRRTGILLDPTYTGKAFTAYYDNFLSRSKQKVLFLHTGGFFGIFSKRKAYLEG
jgi:D-cysteine desulfhydrase